MERLIVLAVLVVLAVIVAFVLQRRRPDPPSAPSYRAPSQLDRSDFNEPNKPALVAVFASETCVTCPEVWSRVVDLESAQVAVQQITVQAELDLHQRYRIDGVPTTVVADHQGVVVTTFFGGMTTGDVIDALNTTLSAANSGDEDGRPL